MRILFCFILLWAATCSVHAQGTGKVTGQLVNTADKTISYTDATVSLVRVHDTVVLKSVLVKTEGSFLFENVPAGKYKVFVTMVGYVKAFSNIFEFQPGQENYQVPALSLQKDVKAMAGVTVKSTVPLVEHKADRMVVNVDASISNVGTTALDVLEKSPGITVDKDGNISLKGKEGILVLIDGRSTQLGGADLANLLRNMNASQMDQVEIMTNPPARFDAAGNAGVINIKTKKTRIAGYNGSASVTYTQGRYAKTSEGFNLNYKAGKLALMTNLSHSYRKNFNVLKIQRNLREGNTTNLQNYFDQESNRINVGNAYNAKVGLDYFASKKTTFGVMLSGMYNPSENLNRNVTNISTSSKQLQSVTRASVATDATWKNFGTNFNFRHLLDTSGKELTGDVDYMNYESRTNPFMVNSYFDASGSAYLKADSLTGALPQNIIVYSGRIDYLQPLKKGARFEAGIKSSIVETDANAIYDSIQYGKMVHDFNRSNHFIYRENINAAYINFNTPLSKKLNAQFGLRLENTIAKGDQLATGESFKRDYTELFPTAYFQYKINKNNNLGLNYGRRLRRPNYESLNPFIRFMDRYTYTQGNPDLKPQFSQNVEMSHTYKNFLTTTLNYTTTNNIIQSVIEQKGQEAYSKQVNIASMRQYGIAISANHTITKWWTNNFFVNLYSNHFKGIVNNVPISFTATTITFNGTQQFKLTKTTTAEISGIYRSPGVQGVITFKARGGVAAGFSQQVIKNNGVVRLLVRDIFYTQKGRASTKYGNVDATFQEMGDSRTVALGFTYRFSKGKVANQKRRTGSANEEQDRIGIE